MKPVRAAALILAAVLAGGVVAFVLISRSDDEGEPRRVRERTMRIAASVEPRVHLFGDPVVAHLDLLFLRSQVDPERISVDAVFQPYEQVGPEHRERTDVGDRVRLRISYPLQCLARACAPRGERRELQLAPVRVFYVLRDVRARANDIAEWPPIDVASRLGPFDVREAPWRADLEPPPVSYRVSPGWLAAGLGGSSLLLVLAAAFLGWRLLERRPEAEAVAYVERRPPLERALEELGLVCANGDAPARRRALERLARELERVAQPGLATRARRLAWSPPTPDEAEVELLTDEVRGSVGGVE